MFLSSETVTGHALRGAVGIASLWCAIHLDGTHSWLALGLGVLALATFKGCPICWTIGLFGTVYERLTGKTR